MLRNLNILNGEMPLKFDSLNTIYTVNLTTEDDYLKLDYEISDDAEISVYGNKLEPGLNEVVLTVFNNEDTISYYLYVYKEEKELATSVFKPIEKEEKELPNYVAPAIASSCFLFILLFFTLLFKKSKKCRFN